MKPFGRVGFAAAVAVAVVGLPVVARASNLEASVDAVLGGRVEVAPIQLGETSSERFVLESAQTDTSFSRTSTRRPMTLRSAIQSPALRLNVRSGDGGGGFTLAVISWSSAGSHSSTLPGAGYTQSQTGTSRSQTATVQSAMLDMAPEQTYVAPEAQGMGLIPPELSVFLSHEGLPARPVAGRLRLRVRRNP